MPSRPAWTGEVRVALVSCAVSLHPAVTRSERIRYHYLNGETGNRLRQQYVDEVTGEVVAPEDRVRGYETADGGHALLTEAEVEQIELPASRTLDIQRFVPALEVDRVFLDQPFIVLPDEDGDAEAFAVIRDAMARAGVAGVGTALIYRRERPVLLEPRGMGMLATTLRYPDEIRADVPYLNPLADRPAPPELTRLAAGVVARLAGPFKPELFEDRYREALLDLIEAKRTGAQWVLPGPAERAPARIGLADALRRSRGPDAPSPRFPDRRAVQGGESEARPRPGRAAAGPGPRRAS